MPSTKHNAVFSVDGYEVSATFAQAGNPAAITHVKQILLSAFVASTPKARPKGILAMSPEQRDNSSGGNPHVP